MLNRKKGIIIAAVLAAMVFTGGCSRGVLNYQIAECIGTLNQYENNEPVETPKMKADREQKEAEEELEQKKQEALNTAAQIVENYRYEEAIAYLQNSEVLREDPRLDEAIALYQEGIQNLYEYEGDIPHFCFTNLIVDPSRALDWDEYDSVYRENMITLTEFEKILQTLYDSGYILIDLHDLAEETENGRTVVMKQTNPKIPKGKKPMILSIDNLSYGSVRNGDGVATALAIDQNGRVGAKYTDAEGHDRIGAYDVIPVLDAFIEEHPDFSYLGARGIISVSGEDGVFGYDLENSNEEVRKKNQQTVQEIAQVLREEGWTFASTGYSYQFLSAMTYDQLSEDLTKWQDVTGKWIGACDTLLYPYGAEVDYSSEKGVLLPNKGFRYLIGLWADGDHVEVQENYLRQTRRTITGLLLTTSPNSVSTYINVSEILDPAR